MEILHVIPYFNPRFGGDVHVCYHLCKHLAKLGHNVTILTTDYQFDGTFAKTLQDTGVEIVKKRCVFSPFFFIFSPSVKKWLDSNLNNYDVVHLHDFRSYQNSMAFKYCEKNNVPYVIQAHGDVPYIQKRMFKIIFDLIWGKEMLKYASKLLALAEVEKADYVKNGGKESAVEILPNGIDLNEFKSLPDKTVFKNKYKIPLEEGVVLFLGRLNKIKGIDLLIDTFTDFLKTNSNVKLVIVGPDDGYLKKARHMIDKRSISTSVIITGPLYGKDKIEAYRAADVYILPSRYEMFPNTILESCACGVPVIVTNNCGIANLIDKNVGLSVDYDKSQLLHSLKKLYENPDLTRSYSTKGRAFIEREFVWEIIVNKLVGIYSDIIFNIKREAA